MKTSKYKNIFLSIFMLTILACHNEDKIDSQLTSISTINSKKTSFKVFVDEDGTTRFPGVIKQLGQKITELGQNVSFSVEKINQENINKIAEKEIIFCAFLVTSQRYELQSQDTCEPLMKELKIKSRLVLLGFPIANLSMHTPSKEYPYFFRYNPANLSLEESEINKKQFMHLANAIKSGKFF